jgi:hypothetical protein
MRFARELYERNKEIERMEELKKQQRITQLLNLRH